MIKLIKNPSHTDLNQDLQLNSSLIPNAILPKLEDTSLEEQEIQKQESCPSQDSSCSNKLEEIENTEVIENVKTIKNWRREQNESPIKKWLWHNRNFDIKINLIVNGSVKDNKTKL